MRKDTWTVISTAYLAVLLSTIPLSNLILPPIAVNAQAVPAAIQDAYGLLDQGQVNEAIVAFKRATNQFPQSIVAWLGLAISYRRAGQDENAFQAYERILQIDPNNQLALKSLGFLGEYRPEWQIRGIAALTTLLQLNPKESEARAKRALLYRYQGRFAEAIADYQIAFRDTPTPAILLGAAEAYSGNGNYQQALAAFNSYQQTGGKITKYAAIAYARTLRNTGNPAKAVQVLEPELTNKTDDLNMQVRVELAQAYLANQQPSQALGVIEPLRGNSAATLPLARALNEIGQKLNSVPLRTEAANLYRQTLSQTPNPSTNLLREVADVLSGIPSQQEYVLQLYRQVAQLEPENRGVPLKLLGLERQLGYISRAQLRAGVLAVIQPLPTNPTQQKEIAEGLVPIEPELEFLPTYQALLQNPDINAPFLNFRVAQILVMRNDLIGARNALAAYTATPQAAGDLAPQLIAAEIERREGNVEAAAQRYQLVIATNPVDSGLLMGAVQGLAGLRNEQGRTGEALFALDQLIARYPQDLRLQMARAAIAYQARVMSMAQAEAVLNSWLSTRPPTDTPTELYSLVAALPPSPQREPLYDLLARDNPNNIPVQIRLIQVVALRDRNEARGRVTQLVVRSQMLGVQTVEAYLLQGKLSLEIQDLDLAASSFKSALTLQPSNFDALIGLAEVRVKQNLFDQAEQLYNQALAFKPNDAGIKRSLMEVNVAKDYPLAALRQIEQLQRQQPGGIPAPDLALRRQKIEEDFLQRRGFQPPWERY